LDDPAVAFFIVNAERSQPFPHLIEAFAMFHGPVFAYRDRMKVALLISLVAFAACTKRNPEVCCTTQEDCDAIGLPLGTDCADGLTCIANSCVATTTCQADSDCPSTQPRCGADGVCVECVETAECGDRICDPSGSCIACTSNEECGDGFCTEAVCRTSIIPKYLPDVCDSRAVAEVTLTSTTFDTDDGINCTEIVTQGAGAPEICVVRGITITLAAGEEVVVTGSRALALVADQTANLEGIVNASATGELPGPGAGASSGGLAMNGANFDRGGGGAGYKSDGGAGGTLIAGGANNGGTAGPNPASVATFSGGTSNSGGGGGAITVISCRGRVSVAGGIDVNGGGGRGGVAAGVRGGGGGGSGGYVALQGVVVEVTGFLFANGGAGGGGSTDGGAQGPRNGRAGEDGKRSATQAAANENGNGGNGGFSVAAPGVGGPGQTVQSVSVAPGGGGGSVGFLQIYTLIGVAPQVDGATTSPAFEEHLTLSTK
jgi:hypothetical protein